MTQLVHVITATCTNDFDQSDILIAAVSREVAEREFELTKAAEQLAFNTSLDDGDEFELRWREEYMVCKVHE